MAYYTMFLWIPGREGTRCKVTGNVLVNALLAFHRSNRRYHVKKYEPGIEHGISSSQMFDPAF